MKNTVPLDEALAPLQAIVTTVYVLSQLMDSHKASYYADRYIVTDKLTAQRWVEESPETRDFMEYTALDVNGTYVLVTTAAKPTLDPIQESPAPEKPKEPERISFYP